jgi:hypothetical protein
MYPNKSLSSFSYGTKIKRILKCKEYFWLLWFVFFLLQLGSIGGPSHRLGTLYNPSPEWRSQYHGWYLPERWVPDRCTFHIYIDNYTYKRCAVRSRAVGNERSVTERGRTCIIIARTCVKLLSRVYVRFGTFRSGTHCPLNVSSRDVSSRERNRQGTKNTRRNDQGHIGQGRIIMTTDRN